MLKATYAGAEGVYVKVGSLDPNDMQISSV